jgi:LysR family transcriptional regulator, glycine cleavage system transcriptional activator
MDLHIKTSQSLVNFKSDGVDIAIRFGTGDWKGLRAIKLLDEEFFPVCSPSLNGDAVKNAIDLKVPKSNQP